MPWTKAGVALLDRIYPAERIRTTHVYPPIPIRDFDWCATTNDYDADCDGDGFFSTSPIGWGSTEEEAIADLREQTADEAVEPVTSEPGFDGRDNSKQPA